MIRPISLLIAVSSFFAGVSLAVAGPVVYGIQAYSNGGGGAIWKIDTTQITNNTAAPTQFVGQTSSLTNNGNVFSPNSLASDNANGILYYSSYSDTDGSGLYSFNLKTGQNQYLGQLTGTDATGAFYNGSYYYIKQGGTSVDQVNFAANGTIANIIDHPVYNAPAGGWGFGDIAIRSDGTLFGSGAGADNPSQYILFQINLNQPVFGNTLAVSSVEYESHFGQLAFDGNTLIMLQTAPGEIDQLNYQNGSYSYTIRGWLPPGLTINDLADGPPTLDVVPEPSTLSLGLAAIATAFFWKRRQQTI